MIQPNNWLGLLGGGQLGKMFSIKAQQLGYYVMVIDPNEDAPARSVANKWICADYSDQKALDHIAKSCSGVTTEFENVPAEVLGFFEEKLVVSPKQSAVRISQDRILEKEFLKKNGFKTSRFLPIKTDKEISNVDTETFFPGFLKVSRFGYDGKGQSLVDDIYSLGKSFERFGKTPCVLEKAIDLDKEISVILVRDFKGQVTFYPIIENRHRNGILDMSVVPASIPESVSVEAINISNQLASKLNYVGVMCVEFFLSRKDGLLVNEIAPRPHNSGHFSLDACEVCQFEQQVRALCQIPLGSTKLKASSAVMINLLGDIWSKGEPVWHDLFATSSAHLHLYGKRKPRSGRKMGHYTVLGESLETAKEEALKIRRSINPKP